ncbi:LOB domain-containing protein 1-like [Canna indica]|uniref:LOB domain-containing protein 1-like n=1 Tax=Canna indica TaxID=4628 RepID=A0AAQ3QS92_9LILI|nr:LOB domain-containing protein 1-like [Canna indica]
MEANNTTSSLHSPCAACKILRRRCSDKCALAPYFPPTEILKFSVAHRVFGASNIIKFLQEIPESQRADAVSSLVYEANTRLRDPVYGSAGIIFQLQKQVSEMQSQLARAKAELAAVQAQHENLAAIVCMKAWSLPNDSEEYSPYIFQGDHSSSVNDYCQASNMWEDSLWT